MNLPDGEGLYLWIDRVVERECDYEDLTVGGTFVTCKKGHNRPLCPECYGTGKRRVRVRGWARVGCDCDGYDGSPIEYETVKWFDCCGAVSIEELTDAIIAAHFAGTLPDGVAHIEEVDE